MHAGRNCRSSVVLALASLAALLVPLRAFASSADPQLKTDHPWYPGELSCSTFDRLFATQADLYKRVTGRDVNTDEDKALAAWYWRNRTTPTARRGRTTASPPGSTRPSGTASTGPGCSPRVRPVRHDPRAVVGRDRGAARPRPRARRRRQRAQQLRGLPDRWPLRRRASGRCSTTTSRRSIFRPDGGRFAVDRRDRPGPEAAERSELQARAPARLAGLGACTTTTRRGIRLATARPSTLRLRRPAPDGPPPARRDAAPVPPARAGRRQDVRLLGHATTAPAASPARSATATWVNQPEKMYGSQDGTGHHDGQVRFANAVYTYAPDFADERLQGRSDRRGPRPRHVRVLHALRHRRARRPNDESWGIYKPGGRNGLVLHGTATCPVPALHRLPARPGSRAAR